MFFLEHIEFWENEIPNIDLRWYLNPLVFGMCIVFIYIFAKNVAKVAIVSRIIWVCQIC